MWRGEESHGISLSGREHGDEGEAVLPRQHSFEGPPDAAADLGGWVADGPWERFVVLPANLFWQDARAWCVATQIDFNFTCVGGSDALINELLEHPRLKVVRRGVKALQASPDLAE